MKQGLVVAMIHMRYVLRSPDIKRKERKNSTAVIMIFRFPTERIILEKSRISSRIRQISIRIMMMFWVFILLSMKLGIG